MTLEFRGGNLTPTRNKEGQINLDNRKENKEMRKRDTAATSDVEIRLLNIEQGSTYAGMGKTAFREWAVQIGAVRRFGRSVRYDRRVIDRALDAMQDPA